MLIASESFVWKSSHLSFFQEPSLEERQNGVEIKEPLDTIFVKSVRPNGPAHLAGLQCGKSFVSPRNDISVTRISTFVKIFSGRNG